MQKHFDDSLYRHEERNYSFDQRGRTGWEETSNDKQKDQMKNPPPTLKKATKRIWQFMKEASLVSKSDNYAIAVSGGVDSMLLLEVFLLLKKSKNIKGLRVFHVNHGTRIENNQEEKLVAKRCLNEDIPFVSKKLSLDLKESNFELRAREKRYNFFLKNLERKELCVLGQHIDDSFEWSLMQQLKSGNALSSIGIPVRNKQVIRPLMCLTKKEIIYIARKIDLKFSEDQSNKNIYFERNWLREKIIPLIKKKYPNYLKNYVSQANQKAFKAGVHQKPKGEFIVCHDSETQKVIYRKDLKNDFFGAQELIEKEVRSLSNVKRGSLRDQIQKLIKAQQNGKKGPFLLSGGVYCYLESGLIGLISKKGLKEYKKLDQEVLNILKNASQIPKRCSFAIAQFPFIVFSNKKGDMKGLKKVHALLPKSTKFCLKNNLFFQAGVLLIKRGKSIKRIG